MSEIVAAADSHLPQVVRLHMEALPAGENILTALGPRVVAAGYEWLLDDEGSVILVSVEDGAVLGFTSLSDRPYLGSLLRRALPRILVRLATRPWLAAAPVVRSRLRRALRGRAAPLPSGAHVAYTAVAASARGRGVGSALKDASVAWSRERGLARMITGVHRDNTASRRMNEKAGFVEAPQLASGDMLVYLLEIGDGPPPGGARDGDA